MNKKQLLENQINLLNRIEVLEIGCLELEKNFNSFVALMSKKKRRFWK